MNGRLTRSLALAVILPLAAPAALRAQTPDQDQTRTRDELKAGTKEYQQERKTIQERHRLELKTLMEKQAEERKML